MAFDRWTEEHHLTPGGWVKGTDSLVGGEVPRPADAVETWKEEAYQRSGWQPEEVTHRLIWHDSSVSEEERDRLRRQFPSPFSPRSKRATS